LTNVDVTAEIKLRDTAGVIFGQFCDMMGKTSQL